MKKKYLTLLLVLCAVLGLMASADAAFWYSEDGNYKLYYDTQSDGTLIITGGGYEAKGPLVIPGEIDGKVVTAIKANAFSNYQWMTSLTLPDSIISIGNYAFSSCKTIEGELVLPSGIQSIGKAAFNGCTGLTGSLLLPDTLTSLGENAFRNCTGFTGDLIIGDGLSAIADRTFEGCTGFSGTLQLPSSLVTIGRSAFEDCSGLTGTLSLADTITSIGPSAFKDCSNLSGQLVLPSGLTAIESNTFYGCSGFAGDLAMPEGLISIGEYAFADCGGLTGSLILPEGLISIGNGAFRYCSGMTGELVLPSTLESIGASAFRSSNFSGDLILPDSLTTLGYEAFSYSTGFQGGQLKLSENLTTIDGYAFRSCTGFTGDLVIPDSVTTIGTNAFRECSGLTGSLTLGTSLFSVSSDAFSGVKFSEDLTIKYCDSTAISVGRRFSFTGDLTVLAGEITDGLPNTFTGILTLGDGVTSIGDSALDSTNFTGTLIIPDSVTTIGTKAFADCPGFTSVTLGNNLTSLGDSAFSGCSGFGNTLTIPSCLQRIGASAFSGCSGLSGDLTIPATVVSLGESAFMDCAGFNGHLQLPDNWATIPASAFRGCSGLTGVTLPSALLSIGDYAFCDCSSLSGDLIIPGNVTTIGTSAFSGCSGFKGMLKLSDTLTTLSPGCFSNCSGFTGSLVIPNSVTTLGTAAFTGCSGFNGTLTLSNKLTAIYRSTFSNCTGFTGDLIIPDGVETIESYAFKYSGFDGSLMLGKHLRFIGEEAFYHCERLSGNLIIPDSVTFLGYECFAWCTTLNGSIYLGNGLTQIKDYTFLNTDFQGELIIPSNITSVGYKAFPSMSPVYLTPSTYLNKNWNPMAYIGTYYYAGTEEMKNEKLGKTFLSSANWVFLDETEPTSVSITGYDLVGVDSNIYLAARVMPQTASDRSVTWSSSDESVATVSETGMVTGVSEGYATITATTVNGLTAERIVEVRNCVYRVSVYGTSKEDPANRQPLAGALVMFGTYKTTTDENGEAVLVGDVRTPNYGNISITCDGYFDHVQSIYLFPNEVNEFTLQHKGDDIYLTQLDVKVDGTDYSLINNTRVAAIPLMNGSNRNGAYYPVTVGVDWNIYPEGTIILWGLTSGNTVPLQHGTNMVALAKHFDAKETISIVVTTKDENNNIIRLQKNLPLRIYLEVDLTPTPPQQEDLSELYITKDMVADLAFGNFAAGANSVKYKDGILSITLGGKDKSSTKVNLFESSVLQDIMDGEASAAVSVYGELDVPVTDPYGEWAGNIRVATESEVNGIATFDKIPIFIAKQTFYIKSIPFNVKLTTKAGVSAGLGLRGTFDAPVFSGIANAEGLISAGGGLGGEIIDGMELSANLMGNVEPKLALTYDWLVNDPTAPMDINFDPTLEGYLSGVATLGLDWLDFDLEAGIKLGGFTWDKTNGIQWYNLVQKTEASTFQLLGVDDDWQPIGWGYLENGGGFVGGNSATLFNTGERIPVVFYENIHLAGEGVLTNVNGTPIFLFSTGDTATQDQYNNLRLAWSQWTGCDWTEPQWVSSDSSADFDPAASGKFIAWVDTNGTMTADQTIADKFAMREITAGVWNGSGYTTTRLTTNSDFNHAVKIADLGNGTALCAWLVNDPAAYAEDLTGKSDTTNIAWAWYNGTDWNTQGVLENVGIVTNLNITQSGVITYKDSSGQLYTAAFTNGTVDAPTASHASVGRYAVDDSVTAWFDSDANLYIYEDGTLTATISTEFTGAENPIVTTGSSGSYIFWLESGGVWYTTNVSGSWSKKLCLTKGSGLLQGLSAVATDNGCKVSYITRIDDVSNMMIVDLLPGKDGELLKVVYDDSVYAEQGQVSYTALIHNNGEQPITSATLEFYEDGTLVYSEAVSGPIAPGADAEVISVFAPTDGSITHDYEVVLNVPGDYHAEGSTLELTVGSMDTAVYDASIETAEDGSQYLRVILFGQGSVDMNNLSVVVRSNHAGGQILATQAVSSIRSGLMQEVTIPLMTTSDLTYHISLESASDCNETNNVRLVTRADETPELTAYITTGIQVTVEVNSRKLDCSNATAIVAVMSSNGQMLESMTHDLTTLSDSEGILSFQETATSIPAGSYVRVMVVDKSAYTPLCGAVIASNSVS